ncbi:MAG: hypothetical protein IV090_24695 [Candidatus Sericytochromatia bacterium]|nr:hypothetical protein [Candidatus Sericytochromatia bacterium]
MTRPVTVPIWGTNAGSAILSTLNIDSIANQGTGRQRYFFSGSPDLSSVVAGHQLEASGTTNAANTGTFAILAKDTGAFWIDVLNAAIVDATEDETGSPGSADVLSNSTLTQAPSLAKRLLGWIAREYPPANWLNWHMNLVGQWLDWLNDAVPTDFDLLQPKLTAGTNITIVDNEDGTERISASLSIATIDAVGDTYTQASHTFNPLNVVRNNGTNWVLGQGNTITNCTDCYLVTVDSGANTFVGIKSGRVTITGHGLDVGELYYLSAATAGLLTKIKPVGDTTTPLGFFLPFLFVESTNVVHVLGNSYPTFNPILARYVNTGFEATSVTFSNLDVNSYDGSIEFESAAGTATNGGTAEFRARINGLSAGSYYFTTNFDTGSAWDRYPGVAQAFWLAGYTPDVDAYEEPMFVSGKISLSNLGGSAAYPLIETSFNHFKAAGISRGRYASTVANITSLTLGESNITWRASASHYVNLIWKGKAA